MISAFKFNQSCGRFQNAKNGLFFTINRSFSVTTSTLNKIAEPVTETKENSLFGDISGDSKEIIDATAKELRVDGEDNKPVKSFKHDPRYNEFREKMQVGKTKRPTDFKKLRVPIMHPKPILLQSNLVSDLKKKLYTENCVQNGGFFKQGQAITIDEKTYTLTLTENELEALEPSIYCQSYRIKSSTKKAFLFLSFLNHKNYSRLNAGMHSKWKLIKYRNSNDEFHFTVKEAITQLQFQTKKLGPIVADVLKRGLSNSESLGIKQDNLYLDKIWVGDDGYRQKQIDIKGRGRHGILEHAWIHVKCILKDSNVTLRRKEYEKNISQLARAEKKALPKRIHGVSGGVYKW
ncbi:hypothetical protein QEN19_000748 [Hanseniaspora menglaensis]